MKNKDINTLRFKYLSKLNVRSLRVEDEIELKFETLRLIKKIKAITKNSIQLNQLNKY